MNRKLDDILLRRGRLQERIAAQRDALRRNAQPIGTAFEKADRVLGTVYSAVDYLKRHPALATVAVAGLFLVNRERFWRWAKRGFLAWRSFRTVRSRLSAFGFRA